MLDRRTLCDKRWRNLSGREDVMKKLMLAAAIVVMAGTAFADPVHGI